MKTIKSTTILFLLLLSSCDPVYYIVCLNDYDKEIWLLPHEFYGIPISSDTTLPIDIDHDLDLPIYPDDCVVFAREKGGWPIDDFFSNNDTLHVYLFDYDIIVNYSWDTIVKYNMVLQRYDISIEDFYNLYERNGGGSFVKYIYFPPTEEMKHIHMWPPYGTYDEHGKRKN